MLQFIRDESVSNWVFAAARDITERKKRKNIKLKLENLSIQWELQPIVTFVHDYKALKDDHRFLHF